MKIQRENSRLLFLSQLAKAGPELLRGCSPFLSSSFLFFLPFFISVFEDFMYFFSERRGGREKERERNIDVREKHQWVTSVRTPSWD